MNTLMGQGGQTARQSGGLGQHLPALDGVRCLAVLMVVALHAGFVLHPPTAGLPVSYAPGGFAGVDVFFVLSGFLITSLLLRESDRSTTVSLKNFYARRAFRLLPALFALLAFHFVYAIYQGLSIKAEIKGLAAIALYGSNIAQSVHWSMPIELSHTWSLSLEEQFYLLWPGLLVLALLLKRRRGGFALPVGWVVLAGLVATNIARIITWRTEGYPAAYMLPYVHADGLIMGCGLAYLYRSGWIESQSPKVRTAVGWVGFAGLLAFTFFWIHSKAQGVIYYGGYTVIALASAVVIVGALSDGSIARFLGCKPLVAIGRVSYGLYLWHVMVFYLLIEHPLGLGRVPRVVVGLALSAVATAASWWIIERPALGFKDRFRAPVGADLTGPAVDAAATGAVPLTSRPSAELA